MVGVDGFLVCRRIVVDDLGVDADRGESLPEIVAELLRLVEVRGRQQLQPEALALGIPLVTRLVEQGMTGEQTLQKAKEMGFECDQPQLEQFVRQYVDSHSQAK